jgi:hypothetical protein
LEAAFFSVFTGEILVASALFCSGVRNYSIPRPNQTERKTILETLLKIIPANRILALTADREFIGQDWFKALFEQEVNPVIRLKYNTMIQHRGIKAPADAWFEHLKPAEILELCKARVMGVRVFVLATLTPEGEFLILATRKR